MIELTIACVLFEDRDYPLADVVRRAVAEGGGVVTLDVMHTFDCACEKSAT